MSKELFISSSPHQTKVAVLEDDQLVEVYYEREADVGLVGGIYKGRVSRVLPGMQSAFVDIGLERDAFLYVSDFYEDEEEYDRVFTEAETRARKYMEEPQAGAVEPPAAEVGEKAPAVASSSAPETATVVSERSAPATAPAPPQTAPPPSSAGPPPETREPRGRRRRRRPRSHVERRPPPRMERPDSGPPHSFEILPGESLAKYGGIPTEAPAETGEAGDAASAPPASEPELSRSDAAQAWEPEEPCPGPEMAPLERKAAEETTSAAVVAPEARQEEELPVTEAPTVPDDTAASAQEGKPEIEVSPAFPETPPSAETPEPTEDGVEEETDAPQPRVEDATEDSVTLEAEAPTVPRAQPEPIVGEPSGAESPAAEEGAGAAYEPEPQAAEEGPKIEGASAETPTKPTEYKYTLREPRERSRFAPRRRRGRRGGARRGARPERHEVSRPGNHQPVQIADLLKEGQEIIVQIAKEPLGTKGARITSHIALPGRYLVYMPTINHIGVSRKIASEEERLRLRNIILENRGSLTGGFIVRTAGGGRSGEEFKADLKFLSTLWNEIKAKAERIKAPALLHRDLELVQRILRDILSPDFKSIRVDSETDYERVVEFVNRCQPALVGHVKLYTRSTPIFEEFGIQAEIDKALKPKVWLKSGGYVVINQTEALVAIDVNTGKYVGKTNRLEDTIVKTNIDAVNEIVRQLRLRDLGGIIVIDFIDMDERRNRNKVVQALEEALRRDRAPTKILSFNEFGLVAITRKRVKHSLERTLCEPCHYCTGSGWIKSVDTVCHEIAAEVRKMAPEIEGDVVTVRVSPEVAHALKSRQSGLLSELEALTHKDMIVKSDATVHQERFEVY